MKAELADALWHGRAKLARAEQGTDAEPGYSASVYLVDAIVGLLYALADRPLPAGSRRFDLVGSLDLPAHHMALFEQLCAGPARGRAAAELGTISGHRWGRHPATPAPTTRGARRSGNVSGMGTDYPAQLLAREAAPAYEGEGPFALWHFSEDPSLGTFHPRRPGGGSSNGPLVWAIDTRHAPMFWFPRDCPRGCIWPGASTTQVDRERFFGQSAAGRVHVIEAAWLDRMRDCELFAYRLPSELFRPHHEVGGYWVTEATVDAAERVAVGDLLARHAAAGIELRITPSIWPFWRRVAASTLEFSGCRLRNAAPHPDQLP